MDGVIWSLANNYNETVTLLTSSLLHSDGSLIEKITSDRITKIWGSGDIEPGGTFDVHLAIKLLFYDVSEFQTVWTIRTATQGIVRCTYKSSLTSCIYN